MVHCGLRIADCGSPKGEFRRDNRMARMKSSISCYPVKKIRNPKCEIPSILLSCQNTSILSRYPVENPKSDETV